MKPIGWEKKHRRYWRRVLWDMRLRRLLDFVASLCFCFDVDWDKDFEDDEWCLERRNKNA